MSTVISNPIPRRRNSSIQNGGLAADAKSVNLELKPASNGTTANVHRDDVVFNWEYATDPLPRR